MLGIVTPAGVELWGSGSLKRIRDYSAAILGATAITTDTDFFSYSKGEDVEVNGQTGTYSADRCDTNLETKNRSPSAPCTYVHFGIELSPCPLLSEAAPTALIDEMDVVILASAAWFLIRLGQDSDVSAEGTLLDWPSGKGVEGLVLFATPRAVDVESGFYTNGELGEDVVRKLPAPKEINQETYIGVTMQPRHSGLDLGTTGLRVVCNFYGQKR